ncbi:MAG: acyl-CoA reductase [Thermoanaerobaculia bacterium]
MAPLIHDAAVPDALPRPAVRSQERNGVFYTAATWTPAALGGLAERLTHGAATLAELPTGRLREAWSRALSTFLDPASRARRALETSLPRLSGLSPAGTDAALRTVVGGAVGGAADAVFETARERRGGGLVTIVLASNLPALAVQPLLPALALGRPALVKSAGAEPLFAPALVRALVEEEPRLADALAAVTWTGGDRALEEPVLARSETLIAYGDEAALDDLGRRFAGRLVGYGPRISVAALGADAPRPGRRRAGARRRPLRSAWLPVAARGLHRR